MALVALKMLFSILSCVMFVAVFYAFAKDNFSSCFDPHARWMQAALTDFMVYFSFITAWYFYKESRWIIRAVLVLMYFWLGSCILCGYIVMQLFKLSREELLKDPLYFVLATRQKRDVIAGHLEGPSVIATRVIVVALGCIMVGLITIVFIIDGSPIRAEIFSPCMQATLVDLCIHAVVFSVWIGYKESSWIIAFFWTILLACFGSITLCAYLARELFYLSREQHVSLILFSKNSRDLMLRDLLLHSNV